MQIHVALLFHHCRTCKHRKAYSTGVSGITSKLSSEPYRCLTAWHHHSLPVCCQQVLGLDCSRVRVQIWITLSCHRHCHCCQTVPSSQAFVFSAMTHVACMEHCSNSIHT
jgi:hypothetical protein